MARTSSAGRASSAIIALACAIGLALTGAVGARAAEPDASGLPDHIVNGDFQTFGNRIIDMRRGGSRYLTYVDENGMVMDGGLDGAWRKYAGWDATAFGWKSDDTARDHQGIVELQRHSTAQTGSDGNVWAEICAQSVDTYIYQDIATTPGAVYTWHLDHAARNAGTPDSMQVMIGTPGHETAQQATRAASNDPADKVGETSDTITTHGTGQSDGWSTYEGVYVVPDGQTVTRFTFKAVTGVEGSASGGAGSEGNLIDNVGFTVSWPLTYSLNGGQGNIPNKEG